MFLCVCAWRRGEECVCVCVRGGEGVFGQLVYLYGGTFIHVSH